MTHLNGHDADCHVDLDDVFRALSHGLRRRILIALMTDNPRRRDEFKTVEFRPTETAEETIELELKHAHLPQLDDAGFIDWNQETDTVTRGANFEEIRPLLELMDDHAEELPGDWP